MGYKLIALDIDGTIRSNEHPLTGRTRAAIDASREAGAVVTVATGRMYESAVASTVELDLRTPIVSFQGAHVADPESGEVLWHRPLTESMALAALEALDGWDREIVSYHGRQVFVSKVTPWVEAYGERNRGGVQVVDDLREMASEAPTRLVAVGEESDVEGLAARLRDEFRSELHVTRSLPHFCEILHPEGGKHRALAWLCGRLGIEEHETIAFGDGYNDVDMLRWAGLGVAVGDAVAEALQAADRIAPPMEEDGAAQVLEDLLGRGLVG
jgi:Cof subfamily protein (haloacid dehalogenase superfamily)